MAYSHAQEFAMPSEHVLRFRYVKAIERANREYLSRVRWLATQWRKANPTWDIRFCIDCAVDEIRREQDGEPSDRRGYDEADRLWHSGDAA